MSLSKIILLIVFLFPAFAHGTGTFYMTKDAALKMYFQHETIERKTEYISEEQRTALKRAARAPWDHGIVTYYVGKNGNAITGYAFFESVTVRTKTATYMVVMDPDFRVRAIEILAFYEPEDYKPSKRWLEQFKGKNISDELTLRSGVKNIVGATLSAQALSDGARRFLAFCNVILKK